MKIATTIKELEAFLAKQNQTIGFVPTMGALHQGHLELINKSKEQNELTVVSIFVNPTQFLAGEDFSKYPRKEQADIEICKRAGVDLLFMPTKESIYSEDEPFIEAPKIRGYILEGYTRPGHFSGVLTVVLKLLNIVRPKRAYFGKKDAQQLFLIQKMVKSFFLPVEIVAVDTVREPNGLALSSRNAYLSSEEKKQALKISAALKRASKLIGSGVFDVEKIQEEMRKILEPLQVEYVAIVNREFEPLQTVELGNTIILVEAIVGSTRLLDNIWL